ASGEAAAPARRAMKLRRLMQILPVEDEPTKGQRCASQQFLRPMSALGRSRHSYIPACPVRPKSGHSATPMSTRPGWGVLRSDGNPQYCLGCLDALMAEPGSKLISI